MGLGATKPFTAVMVNVMPDREVISKSQCFPRWSFQGAEAAVSEGQLFASGDQDLVPIDNISDWSLDNFRTHYGDNKITKDDIFDYVYGVLHAPDFRASFPIALSRNLPRVPMAQDFWSFAKAGAELAELHVGYETCEKYPLELRFEGDGEPQAKHYRLDTRGMKHGGKRPNWDKSVLLINPHLSLHGIPDEAYEYEVNGRTPLGWFIDRYKVKRDKKSGILNDPNEWWEKPEDLVSAIRRIVHVSLRTVEIVRGLPSTVSPLK